MKKLLLILFAVFTSINSFSQDIITLKNGDEIKSKVLEVLSDQVKYKKWENIDGPTYSSLKSEIFMIKYQNGTKDVFKTIEAVNTNLALVSNEDAKKNEAVIKLESYVKNKITGQVIKFDGFRKTNGVMNNVFGQMVYSINFDVDIKFVANGWLKGNDLEGWWSNNFYVYPSQPNLAAAGQQYIYGTKMIPIGTFITLGCVAEMKNTDNGFLVESLSIKTITNHGIVASTNQSSNYSQSVGSNNDDPQSLRTSHIGHFNKEVKNDEYHSLYVEKESPSINKNLFYKGSNMGTGNNPKFGSLNHYKDDKLIVNKGDTLLLNFTCVRINHDRKKWDGKIIDYTLSIQIEDNFGKEYLSETYEQPLRLRASDISVVKYEVEVPIKIDPKKMLLLPTLQDLYLNILVKGKTEKKSIWEGFVKFKIEN